MRVLICALIVAALAVTAFADATVTGKWTGSFHSISPDGEARESTAVMILKQSGPEVTGTAGPDESDQHLTLKGKIGGNKITLDAQSDGRTIHFDLVLAADRITGDMNMVHSGQTAKAKIDLTRAK
jgi:hypothetical protein